MTFTLSHRQSYTGIHGFACDNGSEPDRSQRCVLQASLVLTNINDCLSNPCAKNGECIDTGSDCQTNINDCLPESLVLQIVNVLIKSTLFSVFVTLTSLVLQYR